MQRLSGRLRGSLSQSKQANRLDNVEIFESMPLQCVCLCCFVRHSADHIWLRVMSCFILMGKAGFSDLVTI